MLLEAMGLITVCRVPAGTNNRRQSSMQATHELRLIWEKVRSGSPEPTFPFKESIWLKAGPAKKKILTDYRSNKKIDTMRRDVESINEMLQSANIKGCGVPSLVRIFTDDFDTHGRLYAMGDSWQNMRSDLRGNIRIDGESVVEDDYSGIHITMLYDLAGLPVPAKAFTFDEWAEYRSLVKRAFYTLVNANTLQSAIGAIKHSNEMSSYIAHVMSQDGWIDVIDAEAEAIKLVEAIKERHSAVSEHFHTGAGMKLMNLDSNLAMNVICDLRDQGIVALPLYDSFIVKKSKARELRKAMLDAAEKAGFPSMKADRK